jgi:hypothetical protein
LRISGQFSPAVPQRPKPALKMVDPLVISATASSALLKIFEAPRAVLGVGLGSCACFEVFSAGLMKDRVVFLETRACACNHRLRVDGCISNRFPTWDADRGRPSLWTLRSVSCSMLGRAAAARLAVAIAADSRNDIDFDFVRAHKKWNSYSEGDFAKKRFADIKAEEERETEA